MSSLKAGLGLALLFIGALVFMYNGLIRKKTLMQEGWSGIDVQLRRRSDLIPNLVEVVKGYAAHESGVFEKVAQMRSEAFKATAPEERGKAEGMLTTALGQLMAIVENYPVLQADKNFQDLQKALADVEEQIQYARRYYNATVRDFNIGVQSFPSNIIASMAHFSTAKFFEIEDPAEKDAPHISV